jgi:hypothetical protein
MEGLGKITKNVRMVDVQSVSCPLGDGDLIFSHEFEEYLKGYFIFR